MGGIDITPLPHPLVVGAHCTPVGHPPPRKAEMKKRLGGLTEMESQQKFLHVVAHLESE